jgi:hypothetical protein
MTTGERNAAWLRTVLLALSPIAAAVLAASFVWGVEGMAAGAPFELLGWTPRPCPGCAACGLSRAFSATSHGELAAALRFHPGIVLIYPLFWALALAGPALALRPALARRTTCRPRPS